MANEDVTIRIAGEEARLKVQRDVVTFPYLVQAFAITFADRWPASETY